MENTILKEELKQFGKVTQCVQIYNEFYVTIKEGFSHKAHNVNKAMKVVQSHIGEEFPLVVKARTDSNLFQFVFKRK